MTIRKINEFIQNHLSFTALTFGPVIGSGLLATLKLIDQFAQNYSFINEHLRSTKILGCGLVCIISVPISRSKLASLSFVTVCLAYVMRSSGYAQLEARSPNQGKPDESNKQEIDSTPPENSGIRNSDNEIVDSSLETEKKLHKARCKAMLKYLQELREDGTPTQAQVRSFDLPKAGSSSNLLLKFFWSRQPTRDPSVSVAEQELNRIRWLQLVTQRVSEERCLKYCEDSHTYPIVRYQRDDTKHPIGYLCFFPVNCPNDIGLMGFWTRKLHICFPDSTRKEIFTWLCINHKLTNRFPTEISEIICSYIATKMIDTNLESST